MKVYRQCYKGRGNLLTTGSVDISKLEYTVDRKHETIEFIVTPDAVDYSARKRINDNFEEYYHIKETPEQYIVAFAMGFAEYVVKLGNHSIYYETIWDESEWQILKRIIKKEFPKHRLREICWKYSASSQNRT